MRTRIQEGALSAERTPVNPPAPTRLVPLDQWSASAHELLGYQVDPSSNVSGGFMSVPTAPPPPKDPGKATN